MVFESIVTDLLNKFLGDYVQNLDKKQLKIGIWGGDVVLNNLSLRENALDDLDLPVQLVYGHLGKLVLKIPWKNLYSQPVVAQVEDLYVLISPKKSVVYDAEKESKYEIQAKQSSLQELENRRKLEKDINKPKPDASFTEKLTAQIVNNLQVKIANVHIRYEDETMTGAPFAFGVTLHGLEIYTTDANWKRSYMTEQLSKVYKIADLDSIAAYMNCNARVFTHFAVTEFEDLFKSTIAVKNDLPKNYSYILGPISIGTKLQLNMNPEYDVPPFIIPKVDLMLEVDKLNIGITKVQFQNMLKLGDALNQSTLGLPYRKYRPYGIPYRGHYKQWWNFAITCILDNVHKRRLNWSWEHIKQHRKLCKTYADAFKQKLLTKKPSMNLLETINLCEQKLDLFNLTLIRNQVYVEVDVIKEEEKKATAKSSWFGWWGSSKEDDGPTSDIVKKFEAAMTPEEKAKLYKAIGYKEDAHELVLPKTYEAIKMYFKLNSLEVGVNDEITKEGNQDLVKEIIRTDSILHLIFSTVTCNVTQRPAANAIMVKVTMKEMLLTGYKTGDSFPVLIETHRYKEENLLDILFETNPLDEKCDQRVKVSTRPLEIIYHAETIIQLSEVFKAPQSVNLSNLESAASDRLSNLKERSALGFQYIIDSHPMLELDVKLMPTIIVIPHSGTYISGESSLIVVSLGTFKLVTEPRATKNVQILHQMGAVKEEILREMMESSYDKFKVAIEDIQILVAKSHENWRQALQSGQQTEMHILSPALLKLTTALCLISDDPRLPKTKVSILLPSIKINATEERIFEALSVVTSIPFPETEVSQQPLTKAASFAASTMSLKRLLEGEKEKVPRKTSVTEITPEIIQYTDLDATFALKELMIVMYKIKEDKETPSDQYGTPIEEFSETHFEDQDSVHSCDPSQHEKILEFKIIQLEANVVQRTYELTGGVKLGAINVNQYDKINNEETVHTMISTPRFRSNLEYLLTISYTSADKKSPEFMTKYGSIEQLIIFNFSTLVLTLHQECLMRLLEIANGFKEKLEEIELIQQRDRIASAADDFLTIKVGNVLETIAEEEGQVVKKPEKSRRKTKVVDSIKVKVLANLRQVAVELTCRKRPISTLKVKHIEAGLIIKTSYTEVSFILKDILVTDLNPKTIHSQVLSIIGENALNCQVVIYNLDETANYNSDDMKIDVTMGCVRIVFLNWFVTSCLTFLNNFQAAQEAIANAGAAAADAAKQNVVDAYEKATRLKFNVKIKAPIIIVPVDSTSVDAISLDLGFLSITNSSTSIPVPKDERSPAIIDEIKLELKDMQLSKVVLNATNKFSQPPKTVHPDDFNLTYGLKSNINILDPISFTLIVDRNVSASWYKQKPELDVSGRIKSIELNLMSKDYELVMLILSKNLSEGQGEFTVLMHPEKTPAQLEDVAETAVAKVDIHQSEPATEEAMKDLHSPQAQLQKAVDLLIAVEKKKYEAVLNFNFQLDGVVVNLMTDNNEGLASFGFYVLSVKGKKLVDGTLSTSVVLCDLQLDDVRPSSKSKITKYLRRKEKNESEKSPTKNIKYMLDVVAIIKDNSTFVELRVCAFDLIISLDFLLKIAEFLTVPEQESAKQATSAKVDVKAPPKAVAKKKPTPADQRFQLSLHLEEPDIILIENLEDFNTHAIIFNSEVNLKFRSIGEKQIIYGDIKDLKMYMCSFLPERREATRHFIIYPCTITLQGSTPQDKGLHINLKLSDVIINISPATIELINKAINTVLGGSAAKQQHEVEPPNYSHIWAVADYKEEEYWFMRIEEGYEAKEDFISEEDVMYKPETCIIEVPSIILVFESGLGYYTKPLLSLETKMNASIKDWSRDMKIDGNLILSMSYYNDALAVWEPLIEPNERINSNGIHEHSPWELNLELNIESKKDDDSENQGSITRIKVHSTDILEITLSKTCFELIQYLGEAFSQAFDPRGLDKPVIMAPYVLENDTGFDITIDFTKGIFTLHEAHIPSLNTLPAEGVNSSLILKSNLEGPVIKPDDVISCTVSPNGKVYLKRKALNIDVPSSSTMCSDTDFKEYLYIQIGSIKKEITLPVNKADERFFSLYRDTNLEPWGIISEVKSEFGTTKINVHGVVQVHNHFTTMISVYRYRGDKIQFVDDIGPGEILHVPLHAIYSANKELFFSLPGYKRSVQGIKWNDCLSDLSYTRQIQCDPVSTFEPFYINATREKKEVYYEVTSKFTLLSASYTIHLRPPLYLRNALPIDVKVSVAGCSVHQDHSVQKGVEIEECLDKSTIKEDFLDYGEKTVNPGNVLHLPTVKLTTKTGEAKSFVVVRLIQYLEKDWSCTTEISENHEEYEVWTFSSYDSVAKMDMELGVKYEKRHGSLMLTIYCPFWMINKTGLTLSYRKFKKSEKDTQNSLGPKSNVDSVNILYHPPEYDGPILFSFRDKYFFGKKRSCIRVDSGEWSEKIPLDVAGSTGVVECKANDMVYHIGVHNHLTSNSLTKQITFIPFYIIINKACFSIEVQEASRPGDPWTKIEPNACVPLWPKADTSHILHARISGERCVSAPFKYTEVQCTLLKMKNKYGGINVDVQVTEGGIFIQFTEYHPGDAPGLIINHTSKDISFWEKGNINERILKPYQKLLFSWSDAAGEKKILWDSGKDQIENDLRRDGVGQFQIGQSEDKAYWVSFLDGTQRVLLFTEKASIINEAESTANLDKLNQEIEISIHGIGISIINNIKGVDILYLGIASSGVIWESRKKGKKRFKPMKIAQNSIMEHKFQEYLCDQRVGDTDRQYYLEGGKFQIDFGSMVLKKSPEREIRRTFYPGIWLQLKTSPYQLQFHAKINRIQIDNQLQDCIFPVVLAPIPPPKSMATTTALKPFIECSIVERVVPYSPVKQFKYCSMLIQEFHIKVDLMFINELAEIFSKNITDEEAAKLFQGDIESINKPLSYLVATQSEQEQKHFYDNLHLGPLKIHISFSMAGSEPTALPVILSTLLQGVGVTLTDINDVVFRLAFFEREYRFFTINQLQSEIITHYTGQAVKQLYVLVLGLDVLGNPFGLVVGITKGFEDLFYEPFQGAIQGPGEFAEGLVLGVRSLFGHAVGGAAGAVSKITGAMGKGLAALTFDKDYQRKRRQAMNKKPTNFQEGIARSSRGLVMGVVDGVTGVFTKPISGAREQGVEGFFKGLGKGAVGLVARPTAGVVDFASGSLEAVRRAAETVEDVQRLRAPRFLHADGIVRPYTSIEAKGNKLLREIEKGKYAKTDVFSHFEEVVENQEVLLISNHRVIYAIKNDLFGNWVIQWTYRWPEISMVRSMDKGVEVTLNKEEKKVLGLFSTLIAEGQKKIILIPQKIRRDRLAKLMEDLRTRAIH